MFGSEASAITSCGDFYRSIKLLFRQPAPWGALAQQRTVIAQLDTLPPVARIRSIYEAVATASASSCNQRACNMHSSPPLERMTVPYTTWGREHAAGNLKCQKIERGK